MRIHLEPARDELSQGRTHVIKCAIYWEYRQYEYFSNRYRYTRQLPAQTPFEEVCEDHS